MLKIKVNNKKEYISTSIKGRHTNALENIILLDLCLDNLKDEYKFSDEQIGDYLIKYRKCLKKEKEVK